ncbi:MAG: CapA family protein [Ignavibacteriaceae bacterium]
MKKKFLFIPVAAFLFLYLNCIPNESRTQTVPVQDSVVTITLTSVGDLMCHSVQYNWARINKDSFDFNPVYREVKKYLSESDFTFGNLETVTAGKQKGYSGYPFFNSPDEFVSALAEAGFDLITTSNNHSLDQGEKGVLRTIEQLNKNNLPYNGTFVSANDRDSIRLFGIKGLTVAFLAYTYGTNGIPTPKGKQYLVNLIDYSLIEKDINTSRAKGAEIVLVHFHFGEEYKREPVKSQKDAVNKAIEFGADIIIGGHPHVLQPADFYKTINARLDTGFVAYSLGNFISNQRWRYSDAGVILNIEITKNFTTDSIYISNVNYIPTWVYKGTTERGREYIVLPSEISSYTFLTNPDTVKMKQAFEDTKEIMEKYSPKVLLKDIH